MRLKRHIKQNWMIWCPNYLFSVSKTTPHQCCTLSSWWKVSRRTKLVLLRIPWRTKINIVMLKLLIRIIVQSPLFLYNYVKVGRGILFCTKLTHRKCLALWKRIKLRFPFSLIIGIHTFLSEMIGIIKKEKIKVQREWKCRIKTLRINSGIEMQNQRFKIRHLKKLDLRQPNLVQMWITVCITILKPFLKWKGCSLQVLLIVFPIIKCWSLKKIKWEILWREISAMYQLIQRKLQAFISLEQISRNCLWKK